MAAPKQTSKAHNPKRAFKMAVSPQTRTVIDDTVNEDRKLRQQRRVEQAEDAMVKYVPPVRAAHPWEQQLNESSPAYAAFKLYRDLGYSRTFTAVAAEMGKKDCGDWPRKWSWADRAKLWDAEQEAQEMEAGRLARREMVRRQTRLGIRLQEVGEVKLEMLAGPDVMIPAADVARLIKEGVQIERLAQGESTANTATAIKLVWQGPMPPWAAPEVIEAVDAEVVDGD